MTNTPDPCRRKTAPALCRFSTGRDDARASIASTALLTRQSQAINQRPTLESALRRPVDAHNPHQWAPSVRPHTRAVPLKSP